jgi:hypothetical protein
MERLVRHRQPKGPGTDRPHLHHRATSRLHQCEVLLYISAYTISRELNLLFRVRRVLGFVTLEAEPSHDRNRRKNCEYDSDLGFQRTSLALLSNDFIALPICFSWREALAGTLQRAADPRLSDSLRRRAECTVSPTGGHSGCGSPIRRNRSA